MKTNLPIGLLCGLTFSLAGWRAATEPALAQDQQDQKQQKSIAVEVASGRTFTGQLDARTDAAELWLRSRQGAAVLLRPIRWDRVVQVRVADQVVSGEEFQQIVKAVKPESPARKESPDTQSGPVIHGPTRSGGFVSVTDTAAHPEGTRPPEPPQVRWLAVEAAVANWDGDVEADGLLVHVYPLDDSGGVVSARGTLQFELIGQRDDVFGPPQAFSCLGQWSQQMRVEDFGPRGAVYRLPFQGVHPEFDLTVAPHGALHVRLSVPGQGSFETTESLLRIRPYSAVRDQLQLSTGRRFFPQERTGDGRR